ncbi:MAG: undecaprenyldiphospho-muramoylpentapeptide beta-N-acetylglucosaminyltransferase [Syntrophales bacterium]|nr:undecaprenyldiphospho-muramoylpentapeptide beta-N-acetylglucosaminyltransferase [Syntrophales bacterium]
MSGKSGPVKIIIAGGGTGGHVFPALALADEFLRCSEGNEVLFVGSERGLEAKIMPERGYNLRTISIAGVKGKGLFGSLRGLARIPRSMVQSWLIIREFRPGLVLGVGGYASGPVVMAAHLMGIKTAIAEQNAAPGLANNILGRFANRIFVSFEETKDWFPIRRVIHTGNPVRYGFVTSAAGEKRDEKLFTILVFGGSQGASGINRLVLEAVPHLLDLKGCLRIIHQTGEAEGGKVAEFYKESGINAEVHSFIDDMPGAYGLADLLVCRAGATSIAEITAAGKAAILIPYPHAAGDHQVLNARVLVNRGAAEMIEEKNCTGEVLSSRLRDLYGNPEKLRDMEKASKALGNPDAAGKIVDYCLELAEKVR